MAGRPPAPFRWINFRSRAGNLSTERVPGVGRPRGPRPTSQNHRQWIKCWFRETHKLVSSMMTAARHMDGVTTDSKLYTRSLMKCSELVFGVSGLLARAEGAGGKGSVAGPKRGNTQSAFVFHTLFSEGPCSMGHQRGRPTKQGPCRPNLRAARAWF